MIHFNELRMLFDEAANCMKNLPGLIIAPIIALISMILLIFLSGYTLLCITTAKIPEILPTNDKYLDEDDPFKDRRLYQQIEYVDLKEIRQTFWIFIIGMLWTSDFIFAFEEFCIGAAVVFWYSKFSIKNPSLNAIGVLFKYHLGTIAKGSAVIALFKVPRLIFILIFKRMKSKSNQLCLRCIQFFEKWMEIWNHNAYVPAAMETNNLHSAADVNVVEEP
ncbi:choline transporter-like 1 [Episyrphus balteatus]|uniref:choline transporter-like 1 n=1 Tax=Episyrphus balteatus TaxID=286459 RepID=UPI002486878A|nr:choline transporter-like 1 [Episyrphus balteatus]